MGKLKRHAINDRRHNHMNKQQTLCKIADEINELTTTLPEARTSQKFVVLDELDRLVWLARVINSVDDWRKGTQHIDVDGVNVRIEIFEDDLIIVDDFAI